MNSNQRELLVVRLTSPKSWRGNPQSSLGKPATIDGEMRPDFYYCTTTKHKTGWKPEKNMKNVNDFFFTSLSISWAVGARRSSKLLSRLVLLSSVVSAVGVSVGLLPVPANLSFQEDSFSVNPLYTPNWVWVSLVPGSSGGGMNCFGTSTVSTMIPSGLLAKAVQLSRPDSTTPGKRASIARIDVDSGLTGEWKKRTRFCRRISLNNWTTLCPNLSSISRSGNPIHPGKILTNCSGHWSYLNVVTYYQL